MTLRDNSGVALIMVLLVVSLLAAVTLRLGLTVNWQMQAAVNQSDSVRVAFILKSMLSLARSAIHLDGIDNISDSHFDSWATMDNNKLASLVGGDKLSLIVTDLSGLLQVNGLVSEEEDLEKRKVIEQRQRDLWLRFLMSDQFAVESEVNALEIIDALSDWIDKDDEERGNGAENSYYQGLDTPYLCGNNYFTYPEQLLLVRGISKRILYGDEEKTGIIHYLTVQNRDGQVNLTTAPSPVIQSLADDISEEIAQELIDFRKDEINEELLERADWYKQVAGFPDDIILDDSMLTQVSQYFMIATVGSYNNLVSSGTGILHRNKENEQTLVYWKVE